MRWAAHQDKVDLGRCVRIQALDAPTAQLLDAGAGQEVHHGLLLPAAQGPALPLGAARRCLRRLPSLRSRRPQATALPFLPALPAVGPAQTGLSV